MHRQYTLDMFLWLQRNTGWQKSACEIDVVPLCGVKCLLSLEWMSVCALAILLSNPLQSLHLNCGAHSWLDRPNNRQYPLLSSLCSRQLWMDLVSKSWQGVGHAWEERGMRKQVFAPYSPRDAELPLWCPVTWKAYENRHTSVIQMLTPGASCCHGGGRTGLWLA